MSWAMGDRRQESAQRLRARIACSPSPAAAAFIVVTPFEVVAVFGADTDGGESTSIPPPTGPRRPAIARGGAEPGATLRCAKSSTSATAGRTARVSCLTRHSCTARSSWSIASWRGLAGAGSIVGALLPGRIPCHHARIATPWPESAEASSPGPRPDSGGPRSDSRQIAGNVRSRRPDQPPGDRSCAAQRRGTGMQWWRRGPAHLYALAPSAGDR